MFALLLPLVFSLAVSISAAFRPTLPQDCPCGYVDHTTDRLFTEAIIVYFNETKAIDPNVFTVQSFENKKEKGWYSIFRQGASPSNVGIGNMSSLELFIDGYTPNHLVNGAQLRTVRQDIQYGSFRASMRSPARRAGGSALSMMLKYNASESLELDLMNMNSPQLAKVTNLIGGELPADAIDFSYTALQTAVTPVTAWDFVEYRMDWTDYNVAFWAGTDRTRSVGPKNRTLPVVPQPLYLSHWSTGDSSYMQGPPVNRSVANVAWIRTFFNSSLMTAQEHRKFDNRCQQWLACSMDDSTLRGSTRYVSAATIAFKEPPRNQRLRLSAAIVAGICSFFGVFSLANSLVRTVPWHILGRTSKERKKSTSEPQTLRPQPLLPPPRLSCESERGLVDPDFVIVPSEGPYTDQRTPYFLELQTSGSNTPYDPSDSQPNTPWRRSDSQAATNWASGRTSVTNFLTDTPPTQSRPVSIVPYYAGFTTQAWTSISGLSPLKYDEFAPKYRSMQAVETTTGKNTGDDIMSTFHDAGNTQDGAARELYSMDEKVDGGREKDTVMTVSRERLPGGDVEALTALPGAPTSLPAPKSTQQRVDHLAGLVALACLSVSLGHFTLTFWPYVSMGYGPVKHYAAEKWLYIFGGGYLLTPLWIGPFFMTSSRFLSANYLRGGSLTDIAKKMLLRGPRLLVPVAIVAMLEYFFISLGLVDTLNWLPSISWSTWPYVTPQRNFGVFVNNIVELAYFIPNVSSSPEIITHYCVGVLWTIPPQLQFSYTVLLAAVMIRDMRISWKRFGFYTCCIILGWYARSWSACFWLGLLLADLEVTYEWTKWTQSRPRVLYPVLGVATIFAIGTPLFLVFNLQYSFLIDERGIHPDFSTGLPLNDTPRGGYPNFYEPTLPILLFSASVQVIVELSTWVQAFLSIRPLLWLRPHALTVYLIHGFIFWSLGAWVCVTLSTTAGIPYWANLIVTLIVCYIGIALASLVLTPLMDFTTRATIKNVWRWASEEPIPWIPTTGKFSKALVQDRSNYVAPAKEG